jgi:hypothetical protein
MRKGRYGKKVKLLPAIYPRKLMKIMKNLNVGRLYQSNSADNARIQARSLPGDSKSLHSVQDNSTPVVITIYINEPTQ